MYSFSVTLSENAFCCQGFLHVADIFICYPTSPGALIFCLIPDLVVLQTMFRIEVIALIGECVGSLFYIVVSIKIMVNTNVFTMDASCEFVSRFEASLKKLCHICDVWREFGSILYDAV